ncbi:MAG: PHP domain-containing protein [Clostridia bacterium]|nr:PHP domain-containing protein [Clostridia bacterium]
MLFANTHLHSTFSDGVWTPEELIRLGKKIGHKAMILTDHDTVRGTYFFQKEARKHGLLTMIGAEFNCGTSFGRCHIVGIDFNPENAAMKELMAIGSNRQTNRSRFLFEEGLERGSLRPGITWEDVVKAYPDNDYLCNNQVFELMLQQGIYTKEEYQEFFQNNFRSTPESRKRFGNDSVTLEETVSTIRAAGGVAVLAHPGAKDRYMDHSCFDEILKAGVNGVEIRHPLMTAEERALYDRLCDEHGLYKLGGIDHDGLLGGYAEAMPAHDVAPEEGYLDEANFMKLYRRELG